MFSLLLMGMTEPSKLHNISCDFVTAPCLQDDFGTRIFCVFDTGALFAQPLTTALIVCVRSGTGKTVHRAGQLLLSACDQLE